MERSERIPKTWFDKNGVMLPNIRVVAERYYKGDPIAVIAREQSISIAQVTRIGHVVIEKVWKIEGHRRYERRVRVVDRRIASVPLRADAPIPSSFICPICSGRSATPVHEGCERRQGLERRDPNA
jgi:hypothetical protein